MYHFMIRNTFGRYVCERFSYQGNFVIAHGVADVHDWSTRRLGFVTYPQMILSGDFEVVEMNEQDRLAVRPYNP